MPIDATRVAARSRRVAFDRVSVCISASCDEPLELVKDEAMRTEPKML